MADNGLKPIWTNAPVPDMDLSGDLAASRGTDPLVPTDGSDGLICVPWRSGGKQSPAMDSFGPEETPNSVSSLPARPNRFAPSPAEPPQPPTLQDRNPGTIDQK